MWHSGCGSFSSGTSRRLHSEKKYPRSHYIASLDLEKCNHCGIRTKRCQFHAFLKGEERIEIKGKVRRKVLFDPEKCYGCGLCATSCPSASIEMKKLGARKLGSWGETRGEIRSESTRSRG